MPRLTPIKGSKINPPGQCLTDHIPRKINHLALRFPFNLWQTTARRKALSLRHFGPRSPNPAPIAPAVSQISYPRIVPLRPSRSARSRPASGELELIDRIRLRAACSSGPGLRLGIGDDCALLTARAGEEIAVTTDLSIAGRHFEPAWHPPEAVGHRTLARGLSDLAAMGARPLAAFLSLALPQDLIQSPRARSAWIDRFLDGFLALAAQTGTPLAGGDLAESPLFTADVVLIGAVPRGKALLRSGAHPGDLLCVTGTLGGSSAGLARLRALAEDRAATAPPRIPARLAAQLAPHLAPQPRLAVGQTLLRRGLATAAIDISDGLSSDLAHICHESRVRAEIDAAALPIYPGATLEQALHGGEDYELLFTAPATARIPRSLGGVKITRIGRILRPLSSRSPVTLVTSEGSVPLPPHGWQHFAPGQD